jgi:hypothetical protein
MSNPKERDRADSSDAPPGVIPVLPKATPPPIFNTIRADLLSENSKNFIPCIPNAREPTPFETEFFKGVCMFIVRTNPVDPYFQSFFNGKLVLRL